MFLWKYGNHPQHYTAYCPLFQRYECTKLVFHLQPTYSYFYRLCNQMLTYLYRHSKHNPYICQAIWKHYACSIFPFSIKWCCSINNRQTWQTVSVYEIMSTGSTITIAGCALFNKTYWKGMVHAYRVNRTLPNSCNILWFNACMMRQTWQLI